MFGIDSNDPAGSLVERGELSPADLAQISRLMNAMGRLRDAERRISEASATYMRLNQTDMRALHYLIVCGNSGTVATPSGIAQHLKISTASTTKLLDRLEKAGHVRREPHPSDRRALAIAITPQTRQAAMESVGRLQARRVRAAARLSPAERETVIAFLADMADEIDMKHASWGHPGSPEHTEL